MTDSNRLPGDALGMILAGGRVNELAALTLHRPKSAMPFGGIYRVVDCALTNLASSGVDRVGILSQYRPSSLMEHVRDGRYWDLKGIRRSVTFLPPHTGDSDSDWYKGTADALYQNISFIEHHKKPLTLILSGDHIYRMNYQELFRHHQASGAEMTMCVTPVSEKMASRFGIVQRDANGMVEHYAEKPDKPESNLASMTIYLFETDVLISELRENARTGSTFQVYDEILPRMVARKSVAAYCHTGYWAYSRSLIDYYQSNIDCLGDEPVVDLKSWKLHTNHDSGRIGDPSPVLTTSQGRITNSIVSPGAVINGHVKDSILSTDVVVAEGASVSDSIILAGTTIGKNTVVRRSIIDKDVEIGQNARIGKSLQNGLTGEPNRELPSYLDCGLTVIGKKTNVPDGFEIGTNVLVYPEVKKEHYADNKVSDGTTVLPD